VSSLPQAFIKILILRNLEVVVLRWILSCLFFVQLLFLDIPNNFRTQLKRQPTFFLFGVDTVAQLASNLTLGRPGFASRETWSRWSETKRARFFSTWALCHHFILSPTKSVSEVRQTHRTLPEVLTRPFANAGSHPGIKAHRISILRTSKA
jgi:hypothetical protein